MSTELYNTVQAADLLKISVQTLLKWIKSGKIVVVHNGHRYFITQETIKGLLTPHNVDATH
jgi:excisionase family DNA binding protein